MDGSPCGDDKECCDGLGHTCPIEKTCCDDPCCDPSTEICCDDIYGGDNGYCCPSGKTCCEGTCCDPGEICCDGTCCECDCIGGECLGWILVAGEIMLFDNCYCSGGNCGGEGHKVQYHSCERPSSGGTKECVYELNQPVGLDMDCVDVGNDCGILACYALNAGVCGWQCAEAVAVCTACALGKAPSWACSEALISCGDCLTGEGIDCGCLVMHCVPTTAGAGTYYAGDCILLGGSCP